MKLKFVYLFILAVAPALYSPLLYTMEPSYLIPKELQHDAIKPLLIDLSSAVENRKINDIITTYNELARRISNSESNPYLRRPLASIREEIVKAIAPLISHFQNDRPTLEALASIFTNTTLNAQFQDTLKRLPVQKPATTSDNATIIKEQKKNGQAAKKTVVKLSNQESENQFAKAIEKAEKGDIEDLLRLKDMQGFPITAYAHRINDALDRLLPSKNEQSPLIEQKPVPQVDPSKAELPAPALVLPEKKAEPDSPPANNNAATSSVSHNTKEIEEIDSLILKAAHKAEQGDFSDLLLLSERPEIAGTSYEEFIKEEMLRITDLNEAKYKHEREQHQEQKDLEVQDDSIIFAQINSALDVDTVDALLNALATLPATDRFEHSYGLLTTAVVKKSQGDLSTLNLLLRILNKNKPRWETTKSIAALIERIRIENNNAEPKPLSVAPAVAHEGIILPNPSPINSPERAESLSETPTSWQKNKSLIYTCVLGAAAVLFFTLAKK